MSDLHTAIVDWLHRQPDWLQTAAEKLMASGSLTDVEIQSLVDLVKSPEGQEITNHRPFDGLSTASATATEVRLMGISDVCGIETLAPHAPLTFGVGNLVVVYGHNGSGKSGYTRILKRACGKPRASDLKPNVFSVPPPACKCKISYTRAGTEQAVDWSANDHTVEEIRAIDIFDADAATFYLSREAEDVYRLALDALPVVPSEADIITRCQAAGLTERMWVDQIGILWNDAHKACDCLRDGETQETAVAVEAPKALLTEINERAEVLLREAMQDDQDANDFNRHAATRDKLNIEAQKWISQQAEAIGQEIVHLKGVEAYDYFKGLANSRGISLQAGDIAEQVITQAYVDRFNNELSQLGASRIKVELIKTRTERGKPLHLIRLKGVHDNRYRPDSVLSDGERRIVALAAFLADVGAKPQPNPFVFDDPISSLDHDFEWHVAMRLARLAESRQVIVFTHRLSLYGAIEEAARKIGDEWRSTNLVQRCIESFGGTAGHPADEAVWNANTKKANNILLARLDTAKKAGDTGGADAYRTQAQAICTECRKLLERTVEDDLLNQIVKRHRRGVQTDGRIEQLCKIKREDCAFIDDLMTKYSCYEHSHSQEMPIRMPEEPELRADLEKLKAWRDEFKTRTIEEKA